VRENGEALAARRAERIDPVSDCRIGNLVAASGNLGYFSVIRSEITRAKLRPSVTQYFPHTVCRMTDLFIIYPVPD
jgi:hypothetical protein